MTDQTLNAIERLALVKQERMAAQLSKRYGKEKRFRFFGMASIVIGLTFLAVLLGTIFTAGFSTFFSSEIKLTIHYDAAVLGISDLNDEDQVRLADWSQLVKKALKTRFPEVSGRSQSRQLNGLASSISIYTLKDRLLANPALMGTTEDVWLMADDEVDAYMKGQVDPSVPEIERRFNDFQIGLVDQLVASGEMKKSFNTTFFTNGDSREPEQA
ncbi:DUF3333 domain-containing protein, partial [Reinekea sp.]